MSPSAALLAALPARLSDIPRRHAASRPDAPALHDGARYWSYAELAEAVDNCAAMLRRRGLRPGDRLMVVGENCVAQVALIFAAASLDAWIVPASGRLSAREIDNIQRHAGARLTIYTGASSAEAAAHGRRHGATAWPAVPPGDTLFGGTLLGAIDTACAPEAVAAPSEQQVAALIYTTGTTGQPKGVMLSHRNLLFIAHVSSTLRGLAPSDRAYGVLPIAHVYGLASVMLGTLYAGACLYLAPRFAPARLLHALEHDGLTILQGVPAMYGRLLELMADTAAAPPFKLRFLYAGGAPLDPLLKANVERRFGLPLHNGYGMTESAPTISQTRLDAPRADTSVGLVIPGVRLRLVDAQGDAVPTGAPGELWVAGPNVMLGYYRAAAMTAAAMRPGGWLNTGDLARQEADGALFIVGRTKELIIRSGFNVYPLEVETAINEHPAVRQSAVVGRTLADGDEEVVAYLELKPQRTLAPGALQAHLAPRLASYKLPAEVIVLDALPAAATGKILKGRLRDMAHGR